MDLAIIIPVHNQSNYTKITVRDIAEKTKNYELLVIDNGSEDDTPIVLNILKDQGLIHHVITNLDNFGVSRAWNQGLNFFKDKEYIAILNNDILVCPQWKEHMIKAFELDENIYVAVPGSHTEGEHRNNFDKKAKDISKSKLAVEDRIIGGWAFMISRKTINDIGYFNETFDIWYGDSDYWDRIVNAEKRIVGVSNVYFHHYLSKTLWSIPDIMQRIEANRIEYEKKRKEK